MISIKEKIYLVAETNLNNELYYAHDHDNCDISPNRYSEILCHQVCFNVYRLLKVVVCEDNYKYLSNLTVTENSGKKYVSCLI